MLNNELMDVTRANAALEQLLTLPGRGWLARHHSHEAMAITHDERLHMTPGVNAWRRTKVYPGIH